ncbi:MAG: hypothetical protein V1816_22115 [Pseudomonadota bacterium]
MDIQGVVQTYSNLGRLGQIPVTTERPDFRPQDGAENSGRTNVQSESSKTELLKPQLAEKASYKAAGESGLSLGQAQELTSELSAVISQPEWMSLGANAHDLTQVNLITPCYV